MTTNMKSPLMDVEEVAAYLHLSIATIYSKRTRRDFPTGTVVKLHGRLLFKRAKIEQMVEDATEHFSHHS